MSESRHSSSSRHSAPAGATNGREQRIQSQLRDALSHLLGVDEEAVDAQTSFLELGADSLLLLQASQNIQAEYGVRIPFRQLLEELSTVAAVAAHLDREMPADQPPAQVPAEIAADSLPAPAPAPAAPEAEPQDAWLTDDAPMAVDALEALIDRQQQLMDRQLQITSEQLDLLNRVRVDGDRPAVPHPIRPPATPPPRPAPSPPAPAPPRQKPAPAPAARRSEPAPYVPYKPARAGASELTPRQQEHLDQLAARLGQRTAGSKRQAREYRPFLADNRSTAGFRPALKELLYPIVVERAAGARVWDVDGNEYIDLTMGFGALVFGHSPPFALEALKEQSERGLGLGLESPLAGKAARLLCELTGSERAAFLNSGTEAVIAAIRLARVKTGRTKIAIFQGGYHGFCDEVMTISTRTRDGKLRSLPMAPGVSPHVAESVMVLDYCSAESVKILEGCAHELAAVLVEPQQSRRPGSFDTGAFLHQLRRVTEEAGAALILDEVVTGFRMHPGGCQAIYGVQADIVTYGKAVAGGVPIGVVAGKAAFLDGLDGGSWSYGDDSYPQAESTFLSGTYFKHPLTIPAVWAVLNHFKQSGPQLQQELTDRAARLAQALNDTFARERLPIRLMQWGSMCHLYFDHEVRYASLFYYHLLANGVYSMDARPWYISTAHTDADIDEVARAVKASVAALRSGGFLPGPEPGKGEQKRDPYRIPATAAQKELWALAQIGDDASRAYNESLKIDLRGPLDPAALHQAVRELVERHEALRAAFTPLGDELRISPPQQLGIPLCDLSRLDPGARAAEAERLLAAEADRTFDLSRSPLFRLRLIQRKKGEHWLVMTYHHSIIDGLSNSLALAEMAALYSAIRRGRECRLSEPVSLSKFAAWQGAWQEGPEMAQARAFWRQQFAGAVPPLELPADRPRPPVRTFRGDFRAMTIAEPLLEALRERGKEHGNTMFVTLLGAVQLLFHRLSGQDDLVLGTGTAGQALLGEQCLVGHCVNVLALRSQIDGDPSFLSYLAGTRERLLDAYEHQNYPFSQLIKDLKLPVDASRPPLVSAVMNLDRAVSPGGSGFFELEGEVAVNPNRAAKLDLYLDVQEERTALKFHCQYNADLYDGTTVERWLDHLQALLDDVARRPERRLSELVLLSPAERHQLLVEGNDTRTDAARGRCLHHLFEIRARRCPDAPAVIFENRTLSYRELDRRANQTAHYLRELGAGPEVVVGISIERSPEMLVGLLGILKAGAAYLPLDPTYPAARLDFMVRDAAPRLVLTQQRLAPRFAEHPATVVRIDSEWRDIAGHSPLIPPPPPDAESLAYVIYTSGSTGRPKGVAISHRGITNQCFWFQRAYPVGDRSRVLQKIPLSFDGAVCELFWPLAGGGCLVMAAPAGHQDPAQLIDLIRKHQVHDVIFVPSMLGAFLEHPGAGACTSLRRIFSAGEALPPALRDRCFAHFDAELHNLYGPSEASVTVTSWSLWQGEKRPSVPLGRAVDNAQVYVLDRRGHPVPPGVAGELCAGGVGVGRGYAGRARLTAERFVPDPFSHRPGARLYRTGDLTRLAADGAVEFLGRTDNQVKVRGLRIELDEVRAALLAEASVHEAVVVARAEGDGEPQRLVAYLTKRNRHSPDPAALRARLRAKLPDYMVPAAFMVLDRLPLGPAGKIDHQALPAPVWGREVTGRGPRTATEKLLAELWQQVLKIDRVDVVRGNFFELGGDSILAIQIAARAQQQGIRFSSASLLQNPTIAELAATLDEAPAVRPEADAGPVTGLVPLTPIQQWFFEHRFAEPNHWNMAVLHRLEEPLAPAALAPAVGALVRHHDALRLRFPAGERHAWLASPEEDEGEMLLLIDLGALEASRRRAAAEAAMTRLQGSLDLAQGPLVRVALLDFGAGEPQRLFLLAHHLVVDIVSWQILSEDLITACRQAAKGRRIRLPAKTDSFKHWAEQLLELAQTKALASELDAWLADREAEVPRLPVDFPGGANTEASLGSVFQELDADETRALLDEIPKAHRARAHEILLTALLLAFERWTQAPALRLETEGHGREPLDDAADLTRTVGWFTAAYPLLLSRDPSAGPIAALKAVKERVRSVPRGGIGYGLLRYLTRAPEPAAALRQLPRPEVSFNYAGAAWEGAGASAPASVRESTGPPRSPRNRRPHLLAIEAELAGGRLRVHWLYSENLHRRSTIETLAQGFLEALRELVAECRSDRGRGLIPQDFPKAKVNQKDLDTLLARL